MTGYPEPIAIIGSGCRFPGGSSSPSKLWELLREPRDVLQEFSEDRLKLRNFHNPKKGHHGSTDVQNKSYLLAEDHRVFDAPFFNINPLEASGIDPAQRILLETVYETMESAGYTMEQMRGSPTSVFVGLMTADYWDITLRDTETIPTYTASGISRSIMSNRVSYVFDLRGPSMTIDTACSSSLVALHQAVQSLRSGESSTAIVAGANILLDASTYIMESKLQMLSPDSRCRMWDKAANGYARGEGFAAILLKPLSAALADGDDIECVIRGTGVNSDGHTKGMTMPSPEAQAELIRQTYRRAGLDPVADRCQFFECHGTGTQAGDPVEAQAIADTFFPGSERHPDEKLYVGSIKTIIGHLEGCAGLAGVLKASLAVQNRTVPANMHFNELNPKVEPFYKNLEVLQSAIPWPEVPNGPRRVSVNSFGFGGTNAHAIIESYEPEPEARASTSVPEREHLHGPLVFSARSEPALIANIKAFADYLIANPAADLANMAAILQEKRGTFPVRHFFPESTRAKLLESMAGFVQTAASGSASSLVTRTQPQHPENAPAVLGVFTGQGAQWAGMGTALIERCQLFRESIERCEASLAALPDPPAWSLKAELLAKDGSHLSEAALSQPLFTALQLAMVDLAAASGVRFAAVVGHSSGEIAAAYAAGILSAADAMAIAYYRGYHAKLAQGAEGKKGGMMAIGVSYEHAREVCAQPEWAGRIGVAASNSPTSVTLSGDLDAIKEAKAVFDEHKTFARLLQVDTAYHSHHMLPCAGPYLESLRACNIKVNPPKPGCTWVSSVRGNADTLHGDLHELAGQYWVDNMVQPVLFSHAVESALRTGGPFELAVELGPHPALKGPATQIFKTGLRSSPPYAGFMRRGEDEVEAFSNAVGFLWANLGPAFVDFAGFRSAFEGPDAAKVKVVKGLPSYAWDHDKIYWKEGRISRNLRLREQRPHELLGRRTPDDSDYEMRWRNILKLSELPWIRGHEFQGQALFPGTGHVAMALEAARNLAGNRAVRLFELRDVSIRKALVIEEDHPGVETVFTLKLLNAEFRADGGAKDVIEAEFSSYSCSDEASGQLEKMACGTIILHLGESTGEELPRVEPTKQNLTPVDTERVYSSLTRIGLNYQGPFRSMARAERMLDYCRASAVWQDHDMAADYMVHPAFLDAAFQAMFVALASPATTGALWTTYLPFSIERIAIDPAGLHDCTAPTLKVDMEAFITQSSSSSVVGDVHLLDPTGTHTSIQVEGLLLKAIAEATPSNDRLLFAKTTWGVDIARGAFVAAEQQPDPAELETVHAIERTALFCLNNLLNSISKEEAQTTLSWYHREQYAAAERAVARVRAGHNPTVAASWLADDTPASIAALHARFPGQVDLEMMRAISANLVPVVRGQTQVLEVMLADGLLPRFYQHSWGAHTLNAHVARAVQQITFKHPRAKILEIGAGTGGTTRSVLDAVGGACASYTFTDISSGFFDKAAQALSDHAGKLIFKTLDMDKDAGAQGFVEGAYDVVVAANVLHATRSLAATVARTRALLRPGGFLVLLEITADALKNLLIFGTLPGWWLGTEAEGRRGGPCVSDVQWDGLLRRGGFSGVDAAFRDYPDARMHGASVLVSQAVDEGVRLLREPMSAVREGAVMRREEERLLIVGGKTLPVLKLVRGVQDLLVAWKPRIDVVDSVNALEAETLAPGTSVIWLTELDKPLFAYGIMTEVRLAKLKELFAKSKTVLWATSGCGVDNPESNMTVGIGRALLTEMPHLTLQFLDVRKGSALTPTIIVECVVRLALSTSPEIAEQNVLWTTEPEIALDAGTILLPRVVPDRAINDRFNAERRVVTKTVSTKDTRVELAASGTDEVLSLREATATENPQATILDVRYSTALSKHCNLSVGVVRATSTTALALSSTGSSAIRQPEGGLIPVPDGLSCSSTTLSDVASYAVALELLKLVPANRAALVHEPPEKLAAAIRQSAQAKCISIFFSSSKLAAKKSGWLSIHPLTTERAIRSMVPRTVACFIDLSSSPATKLPACLSQRCVVHTFKRGEWITSSLAAAPLAEALNNAIESPLGELAEDLVVDVQELAAAPLSVASYPNVVDWNRPELKVAVRPLEPGSLFRSDRTYLMVGMTGEIGRSLPKWMVANGARYIVLTSRNANVDSVWLEEMASLGATVRVYRMDVTDRHSVHSVHTTIRATLPPIAGVCNAAMVLSDKLFTDMDAETLNSVLGPKVKGTKILDELFSAPDLDFFVLFSSLASVFGNAGQANYHAANLFMTALAAKRRAKGLAASVMHIGMVADIGYVARAGRPVEDHLRKLHFYPLSEADLQHLFAEAVASSRPDAHGSWNIVSGIDPFVDAPDDATAKPPFYANPRFSHFVREDTAAAQQALPNGAAAGGKDIRQQLEAAASADEAAAAIQAAFLATLESMLQMAPGSADPGASLLSLGTDSLLAVEIRAWFLKSARVDVPVLKLLSGDAVGAICADAARRYVAAKADKV